LASTQTAEAKESSLGLGPKELGSNKMGPKKARPRSKVARSARPYRVDRNFYTSGQAARLLGIPDRTLRRYLSTGKINGIQHPITGTWQIDKEALAAFIQKCGCSVITGVTPTKILVIHDSPPSVSEIEVSVRQALPEATVQTADDPCNALIQIGEECPDVVILKANLPGLPCQDILTAIKNNVTTGKIKTIILNQDPTQQPDHEKLGADATLEAPFTPENLVRVFESLFQNEAN